MEGKTCFKCKQRKPYSKFYKHTGMADGLLGKCKECAKADVNINRRKKIEHYRAYDRRRGNRQIQQSRKNSTVYKAVDRAIRKCLLTRLPCQMCGSTKNVHAHHDDYENPLDVMWLCVVHHKARHAFLDYLGRRRESL